MINKILSNVVVWMLFLGLAFGIANAAATRIMPLGDSITLGVTDWWEEYDPEDSSLKGSLVGYRHALYNSLIDRGYSINFVGSQCHGYNYPGFYNNAYHEGHAGVTAIDVAASMYQWLEWSSPDIVLLHIGTNDLNQGISASTTASRVNSILNNIDVYENDYGREVSVVLAQIINQVPHSSATSTFNSLLATLVANRRQARDRLYLVNMEDALQYPDDIFPDDDLYPYLHPNPSGYAKMANVWLGMIDTLLTPVSLTVTTSGTGEGTVTSSPSGIKCGIGGSNCSKTYKYDTKVTLTATPDANSVFQLWSGCDSTNGMTCTVVLDSDRSVTAQFKAVTRTLTVTTSGTGEGTITSVPSGINCGIGGSDCSKSFDRGTMVVLTSKPEIGFTLESWAGCDSMNGNTCTITLDSNRVVTASFRLATQVRLLSPNGGEIVPAGAEQVISWEAPPEAVSFKVFYTPGKKIGVIGPRTDTLWTVPLVKKNKSTYRVKITAYNSRKRKIGSDESDGTFTIELGRVTFPNQGDTCTGGQTCTITWTKSDHVPVSSIQLSYKLKKGQGWKKIPDILPGDATSFEWTPPVFSYPQTSCMIRLTFMNSAGRKIGTVESDGVFRVEPGP